MNFFSKAEYGDTCVPGITRIYHTYALGTKEKFVGLRIIINVRIPFFRRTAQFDYDRFTVSQCPHSAWIRIDLFRFGRSCVRRGLRPIAPTGIFRAIEDGKEVTLTRDQLTFNRM